MFPVTKHCFFCFYPVPYGLIDVSPSNFKSTNAVDILPKEIVIRSCAICCLLKELHCLAFMTCLQYQ